MLSRALDFLCFHAFIRIPPRWIFTRPAMAILPRAGNYAYREQSPTPPDPGHEQAGGNG